MTLRGSALHAHFPTVLLSRLAGGSDRGAYSDRVDGAVLFADLQGFTALTESLARSGGSADAISGVLNEFFGEAIPVITSAGGDIVKFSGDSLTAIWSGDGEQIETCALLALRCAQELSAALGAFTTSEGIELRMKVVLVLGTLEPIVLRDPAFGGSFLLRGAPMARLGEASNCASVGTIIADRFFADVVGHRCRTSAVTDNFCLLEAALDEFTLAHMTARPPPPIEPDLLLSFLPAVIQDRLRRGLPVWSEEIRLVTAVFVRLHDLDLPLIRLHGVWQTVHQRLRRFEGTLKEMLVDDKGLQFLLTFGLPPLVHEDDARRAVLAALSIRSFLDDAGIANSIGIATGRSFCGIIGNNQRHDFTTIGDAINLASRLSQRADGDMCTDEATARAASTYLSFRELDGIRVKGKIQTVRRFAPERTTPDPVQPKGVLLGRAGEISAIRAALTANARHIHIEGDAGIGKTRLLSEIRSLEVVRDNLHVLAKGSSLDRNTPYFVWRSICRDLMAKNHQAGGEESILAEFGGHVAAMAGMLPLLSVVSTAIIEENEITAHMSLESRAVNTELLLLQLLRFLVHPFPRVVIMIEDAHWCDSSSLRFATRVEVELQEVAFVVTSRPRVHFSDELKRFAARADLIVNPAPLARTDIRLLCEAQLNVRDVPEALMDAIAARGEGNPFFCEELIKTLEATGAVERAGDRCLFHAERMAAMEAVPVSLQSLIATRVSRLGLSSELTAKVASVIGRQFAGQLLREVYPAEDSSSEIDFSIQELQANSILDPTPADASREIYSFSHALIQEVVYSTLLISQRRGVHAAIARWYESVARQNLKPLYPILAHHWTQADAPDKAVIYLEGAANQALRSGAYQEATEFLGLALQANDKATARKGGSGNDALRRIRWMRQLSEAYVALGDMVRSRAHLERSLTQAGHPLPQSRIALVLRVIAEFARHLILIGLSHVKHRRDFERDIELFRAYAQFSWVMYFFNDPLMMVYVCLCGVNTALQTGSKEALSAAYSMMQLLASALPSRVLADRYGRQALALAAGQSDYRVRGLALETRGVYQLGIGQWADARALLTEAQALAAKVGDKRRWIECTCALSTLLHYEGRFEERVELALKIQEQARRTGDLQGQIWGLLDRVESLIALDLHEAAEQDLDHVRSLYRRNIGNDEQVWFLGLAASNAARQARWAAAETNTLTALQAMKEFRPTTMYTLEGYAGVAATALDLFVMKRSAGRADRAAFDHAVYACERVGRYAVVFPIGRPRAKLLAGRLNWAFGRYRRARRCWKEALEQSLQRTMPFEEALARAHIARTDGTGAGQRSVGGASGQEHEKAIDALSERLRWRRSASAFEALCGSWLG